jgi:hypothetical protein
MKGTAIESPIYPIYDLSNPHFQETEITTSKNEVFKGQFVRFKVVSGEYVTIHPSEKYYFLPTEHKEEFWKAFESLGGEFKTVPGYIRKFSLSEIAKIVIKPSLLV